MVWWPAEGRRNSTLELDKVSAFVVWVAGYSSRGLDEAMKEDGVIWTV